METILFPTDFSACADNALIFAKEFSKTLRAKLILYNSFHIPVLNTVAPIEIEEQLESIATEDLNKLKEDLINEIKDLTVEYKVNAGLAAENIILMANEIHADLIVMGTKGASGLKEVFMGTNATSVLEKAPCAVLVVPEKINFKGITKIAFATNFNGSDVKTIGSLADLASRYNAELLIVHISEFKQSDDYEKELEDWFENEVRTKGNISYSNITVHHLIGGNVDWELEQFIDKNNIDILSLSMRKRTGFLKLFSSSLSKKMAFHSHTPILVFHAS